MKKLTLLTLIFITGCVPVVKAQTKPRKKVIQTHQLIFKDSVVYLPDTIPVYFKELILKNIKEPINEQGDAYITTQGISEQWATGYVIWQTWTLPNYGIASYSSGGIWALGGTMGDIKPDENKYPFSQLPPGIFLYSDRKTKVTNQVILTIKR